MIGRVKPRSHGVQLKSLLLIAVRPNDGLLAQMIEQVIRSLLGLHDDAGRLV